LLLETFYLHSGIYECCGKQASEQASSSSTKAYANLHLSSC